MRRAARIATGCVLLVIALAVRADEFWKRKPPQEWTTEEALQILRNSPWARQESVAAPPVNCDPDDYDENGNCRDPRFQLRRDPSRRRGIPDTQFNVAIYLVRWDSAPEVAAAFVRLESLGERAVATFQSPPPRRPPDRYVITMNVVQPAKAAGDPFALRESTKERNLVRLKTSRGTFFPVESERSGVGANEAIHFFFPREQDGKSILDVKGDTAEFTFDGRKLSVKTKFSLDAESLR
jgi:hypothetical protein